MTDEQNAADRHRDQATDDDSPHAHQAPERRSWTDTTISRLTARWPPVLALVLVLSLIPVIVLGGADVELAPGPAVMAGIYMVAYALGRPAAAWAAWPSLVVVLHAIREHHTDIYAGAWVNPYTAALEAGLDPDSPYYKEGYGISASRGRTGVGAGNPRASRKPALHHHAPGHGDAARGVM